MFSALKRLTGRGDVESAPRTGHQAISANLQRKFARGVQYNMKIIIKGDRNVGKTCLFYRLQGKNFVESYTPTEEIQVACIHWNYKTTDDIVKVEVWDVVDKGKKKKTFDGLKLNNSQMEIPEEAALDAEFLDVYKGANGVILVMDITKSWTFDYIQRELPKIPEHIPIMILANHCDMSHHRTVTPHHLTFYVENLQRGPNAAQVRCCESSMRNGFGLRMLHKFFNLPFLQLQKDTLLKQLERNRHETELTIHELDLYLESDDADYNKFLENLVNRRRAKAESASSASLHASQSAQNLQYPSSPPSTGNVESEMKRSVSLRETYRIGPIGGGHPIPTGLHKTAIGVGNPHSKALGTNFHISDAISRSPGETRSSSAVASSPAVGPVPPQPAPPKESNFVSKLLGRSKSPESADTRPVNNKPAAGITSVEEFVPDEESLDRSFLEDVGQETIPANIEPESDSDDDFGNPLVSGFQDDLDPDDTTSSAKPLDIVSNGSNAVVNNASSRSSSNLSAKFHSMTLKPASSETANDNERRDSLSSVENEVVTNYTTSQPVAITGEALDSWLGCDSKWRRSPDGGEDSHSDCTKAKDDSISVGSGANGSCLDISTTKEKKKKKEKESDGKSTKKTKKKKEKTKSEGEKKKKKKSSSRSRIEDTDRDALEEFLNGPVTTPIDASYEAF
ncbi:UNVERIFIED_CONTAM: hypothetical protein PYX00_003272 [Menopon gallinae]|uniref:Rab-like protein 6 n=1 Tax=Menopon gallinae TaxID=328185 RepID=A0AAW2I1B8_9NEOP